MESTYSVFLGNVGGCSDRYCAAYDRSYSTEELYQRVASIDGLPGVDLVATDSLFDEVELHRKLAREHKLEIVSVVADHFTQARWREGTFTATDPSLRRAAIDLTTKTMDVAADLGCDQVTIWPGQDGYDYAFATDYEQQRTWFAEGVREVCDHRSDVRVSLEYKLKEPRNRSYLSSAAVALLIVNEIDRPNCGVVLDYGHALLGYENPAESVAFLNRTGGKLMHVHMNDNFRAWDDDMVAGSVHTIELLEFLYWLERCNYQGWITMDLFPYRQDGRDAVAESVAWLDTLRGVLAKANHDEIAQVLAAKDPIQATRMVRGLLFGGKSA